MDQHAEPHIDFDPDRVQRVLESPTRLLALERLQLLDTGSDERFDRITQLAGRLLKAPICLMSLVDDERQFFKSRYGTDLTGTPLTHSFCKFGVAADAPLVIPDALEHPVLHDSPAVRDLNARAYIGVPLRLSTGDVVGSLCAIDTSARAWTDDDLQVLTTLAGSIVAEAELLACARELEASDQRVTRRNLVVERLMDELRELRTTEQLHVASVMHDHSLQDITSALHLLRAAPATRDEPAAAHLELAVTSLRELVDLLAPTAHYGGDPSGPLVAEASEVTDRFGLDLIANVDLASAGLHAPARLLLSRGIVELVHNACSYSGGKKVWLRAYSTPEQVVVRVADEGQGWSGAAGAGTNLSDLAQELYAIGGQLEVGRSGDEFAITMTLPSG